MLTLSSPAPGRAALPALRPASSPVRAGTAPRRLVELLLVPFALVTAVAPWTPGDDEVD